MTRDERLKRFCDGKRKRVVAERHLRIAPQFLSYLLRYDLDKVIARIDALEVKE